MGVAEEADRVDKTALDRRKWWERKKGRGRRKGGSRERRKRGSGSGSDISGVKRRECGG